MVATLSDLKKDDAGGSDMPAGAMQGMVDGEKLSKEFMGTHHEKQIGALCAVHCLNNLLQGPHFDEVQLAEVGAALDRQEALALGGGALGGESGNVRADGFFSVQVIQAALQHRGLECIPIGSEAAGGALRQPAREVGFILNRSEHWFALRRIGTHWFDFNSTLERPRAVSDDELAGLLAQSKEAGYSVFVVRGGFGRHPLESDARGLAALLAATKGYTSAGGGAVGARAAPAAPAFSGQGYSMTGPSSNAVEQALAAAGVDANTDPELAAAIAASLGSAAAAPAPPPAGGAVDEREAMRLKRLARFG